LSVNVLCCALKAKFHYAIQVTDLVADRFEQLQPVCDLLSTPKKSQAGRSRKLVADPHELVKSQVGNEVCDLDSIMEFGLKPAALNR